MGIADIPLQIGNWYFGAFPESWEVVENHGIRRRGTDVFPTNAVATEDVFEVGKTLIQYVEAQLLLLKEFFLDAATSAPTPALVRGADEAVMVQTRFSSTDGRIAVQSQLYARAGGHVGILTFTTLEQELLHVQSVFNLILEGVSFNPRRTS